MKNGPYILIVPPKDYPGKKYRGKYAYEHHVNYWLTNDVVIKPGQVIHHKNHNKADNRISNLELQSVSQHTKNHAKRAVFIKMKCFKCKKHFSGPEKVLKYRFNLYGRIFCSRPCQVSTSQKERWAKIPK